MQNDNMVSKYILSAEYPNKCFQLKLCFSSIFIPATFKLVLSEAETPWQCQENHLRAVRCLVAEYLNFESKVFGANLGVFNAAEILLLIL